jgi:S1-C subfamily serine protease
MRSQVVVPVVAAVLGGGITAATLVAAGVVEPGARTSMMQQASPLLAGGAVGGTAAGEVYRSRAGGVVGVTSRAVPVTPSAFDLPARRTDGVLSGSGFVVDDDGHILTAAHLVRAASDVRVTLAGRTRAARVLGVDETNDLALLSVDTSGLELHPLDLGDSDAVRVGDPAIVLGRSAGLTPTLSTGTVAARQPQVAAPGGAAVDDALQIDAPLHAADTGGPLLDASGRVTGVNTRMVTAAGDTVELAIPSNTVRRVLPRLSGKAMKVVSD